MGTKVENRRQRTIGRKKAQPKRGVFRPTTAMHRFLACELQFLAKRRPFTQKDVAKEARISEFQASRWHNVNGYDKWHADQLHQAAIRLFNRGKVAVGNRILMTGDPKELEIFGRVLGLLTPTWMEDALPATPMNNQAVINLLVPRPEMPMLPEPTTTVTATKQAPADVLTAFPALPPLPSIPVIKTR
jgi:hypothetical protein